jgi:GNAT superfamily N-acetyltransferase
MALVENSLPSITTYRSRSARTVGDERGSQCLATCELEPADRNAVLEMFSRSSPQTRHDRFHQALSVMPRQYLDDILSRRQFALVAWDRCGDVDSGRIVGLASAANLTPAMAEIAVWVEDAWQRLGVGTLLTRALLEELAARGTSTAVGIIEPGNAAVRRLLNKVAPGHSVRSANGLVVVDIPLARDADLVSSR